MSRRGNLTDDDRMGQVDAWLAKGEWYCGDARVSDVQWMLNEVRRLRLKEQATASREKVLRDACEQIRKRCMQCDQGSIGLEDVGAVAMAIIAELCAGELL